MSGKNEHKDFCIFDCVYDCFAVIASWDDIARRYPAADASSFKRRAGRICDRLVLGRIADEDIKGHAPSPASV
ncbi:MAG TPA: hypothetical protein VMF32_07765 [Xanthobacteraceae bacterium]|nr:hypothetical protein [Xanthobacteraceae bacterium]